MRPKHACSSLGRCVSTAYAYPRTAVVSMHDGAQAGIRMRTQLPLGATLLMPPRVAMGRAARGVPLAATVSVQQQVSRTLRRHMGIASLQRRTQHAVSMEQEGGG